MSKKSRSSNFRTFLTELLAVSVFLFYEIRPQCPYVLSNLATRYGTCWKIVYVYIKLNWRYCLRKSLQCYGKSIGDIYIFRGY